MVLKEDIVFIINPASGRGDKYGVSSLLQKFINLNKYTPHIEFTSRPGHATEIACKALDLGVKKIVAVGGDGTINEVGQVLIDRDVALGIIPMGSGNGLARHLKIPMDTESAIKVINQGRVITIDSVELNEKPFFCTSGIGFDAHIGRLFANANIRGLRGYIITSLKEFYKYQSDSYKVRFNNEEFSGKAFLITFANSCQYGNNAMISPCADIQDGLLDLCIMKPFPKLYATRLGAKLFSGSIDKCSYLDIYKTQEIFVERAKNDVVHLDGEPYEMEANLHIKVKPLSLQVIV